MVSNGIETDKSEMTLMETAREVLTYFVLEETEEA
jgi:hypothetical protein